MCDTSDVSFVSTRVQLLGATCDNGGLYAIMLTIYFFLTIGTHKLHTMAGQMHREALAEPSNIRPLTSIVGLSILQNLIHIVFILFITSNNFGFIYISLVAHAIGTLVVYATQRTDHKHPIHALANALRHPEHDADTKADIAFILKTLRETDVKY